MNQLIKEFNRENLKPIMFIVIVLVLLVVTAYPQRKFGGQVVEVIDGKTAVIQVSTGAKITVVLQFIEVPEAEQPLHQMVREHLQVLILDKTVEFLPWRILPSQSVGKIFVGGIDVSQQMLRDGAAWYSVAEKSAQDFEESELYQKTEAQAKVEKRGVWGVENMKTAWEFRAEKEELKRQEERAKREALAAQNAARQQQQRQQQKPQTRVQPQQNSGVFDMWTNVDNSTRAANAAANGGLLRGSVPKYGYSYVRTTGSFFILKSGDSRVKVESRSIYIHSPQNAAEGEFGIEFFTESDKYNFETSPSLTNLTIVADDQKINLGTAYRFARPMFNTVQELLVYRIDTKALAKIAAAKSLEIKIGKFSGKIDDGYQMRVKNLLAATTGSSQNAKK